MTESQQTNQMDQDSLRKQRTSKENFLKEEGESFLMRPVVKVENLNKSLKDSYEKGHFKEPRFQFINQLRRIRNGKEKDSVSSQDKEDDDQDYQIEKATRKKRKSNDSNEDNSGSKQKRRGRPPKSQNAEKKEPQAQQVVVKKRGRPKGSLNKNKADAEATKHAEAQKSKLIVSDKEQSQLSSSQSVQPKATIKTVAKNDKNDTNKAKQQQSGSQEELSQEQPREKIVNNKVLGPGPQKQIQIRKVQQKQKQAGKQSSESSQEPKKQQKKVTQQLPVKESHVNKIQSKPIQKNQPKLVKTKMTSKKQSEKSDQQSQQSYKQSEEQNSQEQSKSEEESYAPTSQKIKKYQQSKVILSKYGKHLLPKQNQKEDTPEQALPKPDKLKELKDQIFSRDGKRTSEQIQLGKLLTKRGRKSRAEIEEIQRLKTIILKRRQQKKEETVEKEKTVIKQEIKSHPVKKIETPIHNTAKPVETSQIKQEKKQSKVVIQKKQSPVKTISQLQKQISQKIFNQKIKRLKLNPNIVVESISASTPINPQERRLFKKWTQFYQAQKVKKRIVQSESEQSSEQASLRKKSKKQKLKKYRKLVMKGDFSEDSEDEKRQKRMLKQLKRANEEGEVLMMKLEKEGKKSHKNKHAKDDRD